MALSSNAESGRMPGAYPQLVTGFLGLVLGLALVKFGNPVIFDGQLPPPRNLEEILYFGWPGWWGWVLTVLVGLFCLPLFSAARGVPRWVLLAPAIWLFWQAVAAVDSIAGDLTRLTLGHFFTVCGWFYLGVFATRGIRSSPAIWLGLGLGLGLVILSGFQQQFGGLESQRRFAEAFLAGELPADQQAAAEQQGFRRVLESPLGQHKLLSERIYGTLFYPNTLAGVLLLLTPAVLGGLWLTLRGASDFSRKLLVLLLAAGGGSCLIWSGSKAGWLIAIGMTGLAILVSPRISSKWRRYIVIAVVLFGVVGLVGQNLDYFKRGARSVSARAGYWKAAGQAFVANPLTGTGPGTFSESYRQLKPPEAEMARLAHNDYIQQASDSGLIGAIAYGVSVVGTLIWVAYFRWPKDGLVALTGLGLLGWAAHGTVEFGLYVPAIAWPAFFLLGCLIRESANGIDTQSVGP